MAFSDHQAACQDASALVDAFLLVHMGLEDHVAFLGAFQDALAYLLAHNLLEA